MKELSASIRRNCMHYYGCTPEEALPLNEGFPLFAKKSPMERYRQHRWGAEDRRIEWGFTFVTWKRLWDESGKWDKRGIKAGMYVMARFQDIGPYSPENVEIVPVEQNMSDGQFDFTRGRSKQLGKGRGWTLKPKCVKRPYVAGCRGVTIGYFATAEEAEAAYKKYVANL